jgi:hypothetical protein
MGPGPVFLWDGIPPRSRPPVWLIRPSFSPGGRAGHTPDSRYQRGADHFPWTLHPHYNTNSPPLSSSAWRITPVLVRVGASRAVKLRSARSLYYRSSGYISFGSTIRRRWRNDRSSRMNFFIVILHIFQNILHPINSSALFPAQYENPPGQVAYGMGG